MTEKSLDVNEEKKLECVQKNSKEKIAFTKKTARLNALTYCFTQDNDFNILEAEQESLGNLKALEAQGGLQEMLAAQMISLHQLQQTSTVMANKTIHIEARQYFTNTAIKLANTFVQQANLLSKLQGNGSQKIIVERVDVHNGGQAVVGTINTNTPSRGEK